MKLEELLMREWNCPHCTDRFLGCDTVTFSGDRTALTLSTHCPGCDRPLEVLSAFKVGDSWHLRGHEPASPTCAVEGCDAVGDAGYARGDVLIHLCRQHHDAFMPDAEFANVVADAEKSLIRDDDNLVAMIVDIMAKPRTATSRGNAMFLAAHMLRRWRS